MRIKKARKRLLKLGKEAARTLGQKGKERVKELFANAIEILERELERQQGAGPPKKRTRMSAQSRRRTTPARRATRAKTPPTAARPSKAARPRSAPPRRPTPAAGPSIGVSESGKPGTLAPAPAAPLVPRSGTEDQQT